MDKLNKKRTLSQEQKELLELLTPKPQDNLLPFISQRQNTFKDQKRKHKPKTMLNKLPNINTDKQMELSSLINQSVGTSLNASLPTDIAFDHVQKQKRLQSKLNHPNFLIDQHIKNILSHSPSPSQLSQNNIEPESNDQSMSPVVIPGPGKFKRLTHLSPTTRQSMPLTQTHRQSKLDDKLVKYVKLVKLYEYKSGYPLGLLISNILDSIKHAQKLKSDKIVNNFLNNIVMYNQKLKNFLIEEEIVLDLSLFNEDYIIKRFIKKFLNIDNGEAQFQPSKLLIQGLQELNNKLEEFVNQVNFEQMNHLCKNLKVKKSEVETRERQLLNRIMLRTNKTMSQNLLKQYKQNKYKMDLRVMESNLLQMIQRSEERYGYYPFLNQKTKNYSRSLDNIIGSLREMEIEEYERNKLGGL